MSMIGLALDRRFCNVVSEDQRTRFGRRWCCNMRRCVWPPGRQVAGATQPRRGDGTSCGLLVSESLSRRIGIQSTGFSHWAGQCGTFGRPPGRKSAHGLRYLNHTAQYDDVRRSCGARRIHGHRDDRRRGCSSIALSTVELSQGVGVCSDPCRRCVGDFNGIVQFICLHCWKAWELDGCLDSACVVGGPILPFVAHSRR